MSTLIAANRTPGKAQSLRRRLLVALGVLGALAGAGVENAAQAEKGTGIYRCASPTRCEAGTYMCEAHCDSSIGCYCLQYPG